ncbi:cell division protein ZapA [candidate division WOR-3 bacterium]|nr:cell division protein ZapA [candidate division WOR-3 bacterium]TET79803.1 MAG: cell division protein ZapA [Candidatus Cloacimonadota bacterium]
MKQEERIITFNILGEEYKIKTDMDKDAAIRLTNYVNKQIEEIVKKVGYASQTKIAVLAALNIAMELFLEKNERAHLDNKIEEACERIKEVLVKKKFSS